MLRNYSSIKLQSSRGVVLLAEEPLQLRTYLLDVLRVPEHVYAPLP